MTTKEESPFTMENRYLTIIAEKDELLAAMFKNTKLLRDMLAVVHRDGGHYTEKYGIEKSAEDALKIIADAVVV